MSEFVDLEEDLEEDNFQYFLVEDIGVRKILGRCGGLVNS